MKAVVIHSERDLRLEERESAAPGPGEVEVAVQAGGICGSDLHYYQHGGFGAIRVREPMILGHEIAGQVVSIGDGVTDIAVGDRVAVSPSRPCGECRYCQSGAQNHCLNMRFYGSAMPMPHIQGAFRERLIAHDWQCHKVGNHVSINEAAFAEPFSVALHAVRQAGSVFGRKVLITGCGPIGALCVIAARNAGAAEITVTDVLDGALEKAKAVGADRVINVARDAADLDVFKADKGAFDAMIEASGNEQALRTGLEVLRPGAVLVQLGLGGDVSIPQNIIVAKEIQIRGSFRFHEEFAQAVDLLNRRAVDVKPLLTDIFALSDYKEAFERAGDRSASMKVQIAFAEKATG